MKNPQYYFSGTPCKFGNIAERRVSNRQCMCEQHQEQERAKALRWRNANAERARENFRKWRSENVEKNRADSLGRYYQNRVHNVVLSRSYKAKNYQKVRQKNKDWTSNNMDKVRSASRRRYKADPAKFIIAVTNRAIAQEQRTPKWADLGAIEQIYRRAKQLSRETGVKMHVDHVVPLRGRKVSGLHTVENLRIIPATENCSKRHSFTI